MAEMLKIDHICKTFNAGTINEKVALNGVDPVSYTHLTLPTIYSV